MTAHGVPRDAGARPKDHRRNPGFLPSDVHRQRTTPHPATPPKGTRGTFGGAPGGQGRHAGTCPNGGHKGPPAVMCMTGHGKPPMLVF